MTTPRWFVLSLTLPANSRALTCTSPSPCPHISPAVSLFSISWTCRPAHVETRVVLSLSGFTHSRYYLQAPVSLSKERRSIIWQTMIDCALWVKPDDSRWKACRRGGLVMLDSRLVIISNNFALLLWLLSDLSRRLTRKVSPRSVQIKMNDYYLNLCFICLIISSVVSHFFSNHIIIQAMNNNLMKH